MESKLQLCSEWAEDPIELEVKIRKAEKDGWLRVGLPYKQEYKEINIPVGNYVQKLSKYKMLCFN